MEEVYFNHTAGATSFCGSYSLGKLKRSLLERFWIALHKTAQRRAAMKEIEGIIDHARKLEICLRPFPLDLRKCYADRLRELADLYEQDATLKLPKDRIVAILRHQFSNYEDLLASLGNLPGSGEAARIIKRRVNQAIRDRLAA